jgi:uncharacterized protein involved in exopolysaccharide biosynthesis
VKWALALLVACSGSKPPAASGTFMLDVGSNATRDAIDAEIANAIEVVQSNTLRDAVAREYGKPVAGTIHAQRRPDSTVIEVGVDASDPAEAARTCNQVIQTFLTMRLDGYMTDIQAREHGIDATIEHMSPTDPQRATLQNQLVQLELERSSYRSDARALDPCRPRR